MKDNNLLEQATYRKLYPTSKVIPKFYGLPKVHKSGAPLRPIVASRGSITYNIARFLSDILSPLMGNTRFAIKNSQDLVHKMAALTLQEHEVLVSYDVTALFTSVPTDESITIIHDLLCNDNTLSQRNKLTARNIADLLEICLKTTYFVYKGTFYEQVEGIAMGSPVSPIVANLFMEHFENKAIESAPNPPHFWGRYVDDTMVVIQKDHIGEFTSHINNQHPSLQ